MSYLEIILLGTPIQAFWWVIIAAVVLGVFIVLVFAVSMEAIKVSRDKKDKGKSPPPRP